jgi:hypothetical protein
VLFALVSFFTNLPKKLLVAQVLKTSKTHVEIFP